MNFSHKEGSGHSIRTKGLSAKDSDPFSAGETLSLKHVLAFFRILKERFFWGLLAGTIFASVWLAVSLRKEPIYSAEAFLLIEARAEQVIDVEKVVDTSLTNWADAELENHLRKIRSRKFLSTVARSFGQGETELILAPFIDEKEPPSLAGVLSQSITIFREDQLFTILARHPDPRAATLIANRYLTRYINESMDRSWTGNEAARVFLEERSAEMRRKIAEAEKRLTDYRADNNMISLEESQNIIVDRLKTINSKRTATRIDQMELEAALSQVREMQQTGGDLSEIPYISSYGAINELRLAKKQLETEVASLELRYLEQHPTLIDVNERLQLTVDHLNTEIDRAVRDLENRAESVNLNMERLEVELAAAEEEALALDRKAVEYNSFRRELESDRRTFDAIIARLNETNLSGKLGTTNLRILDEAGIPGKPFSPNVRKISMAGGVLFIFGFFALPLVLEVLDSRLRSPHEVESFLGKPLLADIPFMKELVNRQLNPLDALKEDFGALTEQFRTAYFSLIQHSTAANPRTIMVTSTLPSEGKSFVSVNLVACMAKHGLRCLLVDTDFRRPSLHKYFEIRNDKGILPWVSEFNVEKPQMGSYALSANGQNIVSDPRLGIHEVAEGFDLLRSGGSTKKSTELVESQPFDTLMQSLKMHYDVIVMDTPPVAMFTDAKFIADLSDEIIFITRLRKVNRDKARHFLRQLDIKGDKVVGVVANGRKSRKDAYNDYGLAYKYYKNTDEPESPAPKPTARKLSSRRSVTTAPFPTKDR